MKLNYAIATFCYGERYYSQTNRLIESFDILEFRPDIYIVTDSPESIIDRDFVFKKHISEYNPKYSTYNKDYYTFDFSVKRFSLLYAFDSGYSNVILTDTDIVVNESLYNHETIMNSFIRNTIAGQVTYNFNHEINTNSQLGKRFLYYEKKYDIYFDKNLLNYMPEDCVQFISIDDSLKFNFLKIWDECISIKDNDKLNNVPAGNIDEMSFAALVNGINVTNNSNKSINLLIPKHDKWY
jgi:hypothetical protein